MKVTSRGHCGKTVILTWSTFILLFRIGDIILERQGKLLCVEWHGGGDSED